MFDIARLTLGDAFALTTDVANAVADQPTLSHAASALTDYLCERLIDKDTGEPSLVLATCYHVRAFHRLPGHDQDLVLAQVPTSAVPRQSRWATLLAASGDPGGRDTIRAGAWSVCPVDGPEAATHIPVAAEVARWLDGAHPAEGTPRWLPAGEPGSHAVACAEDAGEVARGPALTALMLPYGIRSIVVLGVRMPDSTVVTVGLYARQPIPASVCRDLTVVALGVKLALLRYAIDQGQDAAPPADENDAARVLRAERATLWDLLMLQNSLAVEQTSRLEHALELAERRAEELAGSRADLAASEARTAAILRQTLDAVVLMDAVGRVVEWNPTATDIFGYSREEAVGAFVADLIVPEEFRARHREGLRRYLTSGQASILNRRVEVPALRRDGARIPVELTVTPVDPTNGPALFTGFVRDITDRKRDQQALLESRERFAHVARTLQRSLLPAQLPEMPGVELASAYQPSRAGSDVGGDFFDAFRVGRDELLLTLGDVCGKGAEAAAVTAIARYTIRAVAPDVRHPAQLLRRLNAALLEHDLGERFCSVIAMRVVPIVGGVRLSVSSGGHPFPIVVRADGRTERVGVPGSLLGLFDEVRLFEETVQLGPGDTIVAFTDGVTEAVRDGQQFGDTRAAEVLAEACRDSANHMVQRLLDAVLTFGGEQPRDDIAILALRPSRDRDYSTDCS